MAPGGKYDLDLVRAAAEAAAAAAEARDAAIVAAAKDHSLRVVAGHAGLSKSRVQQIVEREKARNE